MEAPDPETLSPEKRALLEQRLRAARTAPSPTRPREIRRADCARAPLSGAQEQLWYFSRVAQHASVYNEIFSIHKHGSLDVGALQAALSEIVRRHQIWRTVFQVIDGEPVQIVQPAATIELPLVDLSGKPPEEREREAVRIGSAQALAPYDLGRGPLLRPLLVRFAEDHHRLYLCMHLLIFDGVSLSRIILPELITLYEDFAAGRDPSLREPAIQYSDYAWATREPGATPDHPRRLDYWREHLSGASPVQLPLDHRRSARPQFHRAVNRHRIPKELANGLRSLGQASGVTLFQVLAAAFTVLLHSYSGQEEIVFVTLTDMRDRRELEDMVGYCSTQLVLRIDVGHDPSLTELLSRVRGELADGLSNLVPFAHLVRDLRIDPQHRVALVLEPQVAAVDPSWSLHQMDVEVGNAVSNAQFDLLLELEQRPEGHIDGRLIYDTELLGPDTIAQMAERWLAVLNGIVAQPTRPISGLPLPMASAEVRATLAEREPAQQWPREGFASPRSDDERRMAGIWARLLGVEEVGIHDDFFDLGGRSLLALRLLGEVTREFHVELPLEAFFERAGVTVASLTSRVQTAPRWPEGTGARIERAVLFFISPDEECALAARHFTGPLGPDYRVAALVPERVDGRFAPGQSIEKLARPLLDKIRQDQPHGPYYLTGYSTGGVLAYEIAGRLRAAGEEVLWLGLLDTATPTADARRRSLRQRFAGQWRGGPRSMLAKLDELVRRQLETRLAAARGRPAVMSRHMYEAYEDRLVWRYVPQPHDTPLEVFATEPSVATSRSETLGWDEVHRGPIRVQHIGGDHDSLLSTGYVEDLAEMVSAGVKLTARARG